MDLEKRNVMDSYIPLFSIDSITSGGKRKVTVEGKDILIVRDGENIYAVENKCSHEAFPLIDGFVDNGKICCALHGACFDLKSGVALSLPAYEDIETYETRVSNGKVEIKL